MKLTRAALLGHAPKRGLIGRLVGFVHAVWDGGTHAFILDTVVAAEVGRRGVGTRLVASTEAYANPEWKRRLTRSQRQDTVITKLFGPELPCQPYRVLRPTPPASPPPYGSNSATGPASWR